MRSNRICSPPRGAEAQAAAAAAVDAPASAPRKHENWGYNAPDWTVPVEGWTPLKSGEHPRLVFRKAELPRLKKRAETPEGQLMIQRLKKLLDGQRRQRRTLRFHQSG